MKLTDLDPQFRRYDVRIEEAHFHRADGYADDPRHEHTDACWETRIGPHVYYVRVDTIAEAQGIEFLCPKCFVANGGEVGTHHVICWSRSAGVPEDAHPLPGRWKLDGTGFHDLTLNGDPGSRSVGLTGGCAWHGFITNGEVTDA